MQLESAAWPVANGTAGRLTASSPVAPALLHGTCQILAERCSHAVEVCQHAESDADPSELRGAVAAFLRGQVALPAGENTVSGWEQHGYLRAHVARLVTSSDGANTTVAPAGTELVIHVYQPYARDQVDEFSVAEQEDEMGPADGSAAARVSELPSRGLDGVWETLIYSDDVKWRLLHYIHTTLLFSDAHIDANVIAWNRMVLLHGPPGTGKTSLCRALAQKLSIRLGDRYTHGKLVEIDSHSLFSKWFSESGKLVQRLFEMVSELVEDQDGFVVILIDEVESLAKARSSAASGAEPSDSLRVVNALLTQLDRLKHKPNVLVMTTSNLSETIDPAFLDRADILQYIGPPAPPAIYAILRSCLMELERTGFATPSVPIVQWDASPEAAPATEDEAAQLAWRLRELATRCVGSSGRSLRRLPVLAHARYGRARGVWTPAEWADAMALAWSQQNSARTTMNS